jgi:hypothetical protein
MSTYSDLILSHGPSGYWRLNDANSVALDASGNAQNGAYTGIYTQGQTGAIVNDADFCVDFAGTGYVSVPDNTLFDLTGSFTIEAWVKYSSSSASKTIISKYIASTTTNCNFWVGTNTGGKISAYVYSGSSVYFLTTTAAHNDSNWHHIVVTRNGTAGKLYVDGVLDVSTNAWPSGALNDSTIPLVIGYYSPEGTSYWTKYLDDVAVYKGVVLDADQVNLHYDMGLGGNYANVTGVSASGLAGILEFGSGLTHYFNVSGVAVTGRAGGVSVENQVFPTGVSATGSAGTVSYIVTTPISVSETITFTETKTYVFSATYPVTITEQVNFTDTSSAVRSFLYTVTITEQANFSDTPTKSLSAVRTITEALTLSESVVAALKIVRSLVETLTLTESKSVTASYKVSVTDSLVFITALENNAATEAWVVNLNTGAVSKYNNFGFTGYCVVDETVYATMGNKLYSISGYSDATAEITKSFITGKIKTDSTYMLRLPNAYLGVDGEGAIDLKAVLGNDEEFQYSKEITNVAPDLLRFNLGRGLRSRMWEFEVHQKGDTVLEIESLVLPFDTTSRKVI